jgi:HSP20 family protein
MTRLLPTRMPFIAMERELTEAQKRLRRFLGDEFGLESFPLTEPVGWVPKVEIVETEKELVLTAELPGMVKENIEITFENDLLTIQGEKKEEKVEMEKDEKLPDKNGGPRYHLWERTYGAFRRTFTLPRIVDATKIAAEMQNGVLRIHMPKTEIAKAKTHKIDILAK